MATGPLFGCGDGVRKDPLENHRKAGVDSLAAICASASRRERRQMSKVAFDSKLVMPQKGRMCYVCRCPAGDWCASCGRAVCGGCARSCRYCERQVCRECRLPHQRNCRPQPEPEPGDKQLLLWEGSLKKAKQSPLSSSSHPSSLSAAPSSTTFVHHLPA